MQLIKPHPSFSRPAKLLQTAAADGRPALKPLPSPASRRGATADGNRYRLIKELGRGGMGVVHQAWDQHLQRHVAIKTLSATQACLPQSVAGLRREADLGSRLHHPNWVATYGMATLQGAPVLIMQYIPGVTLAQWIQHGGPLALDIAISLLKQTASGLAFAHQRGVVHRDIKPSNLMLGSDGVLRILDLGLARAIPTGRESAEIDSGMPMASVDFLAPEQSRPSAPLDPRSDIYSLGCTLHYLLTAKPLYLGRSVVARVLAHRRQPIPSLRHARPHLPAAVDSVFHKMVAKNPRDRYPSAGALLAALEDLRCESSVDRSDLKRLIATCEVPSSRSQRQPSPGTTQVWSSEDDTRPFA